MNMIPHAAILRTRIRRALCGIARERATVYRPGKDQYGTLTGGEQIIGKIAGYPYEKASYAMRLLVALPGRIDEGAETDRRFMVLYGTRDPDGDALSDYDPPDLIPDDILAMDNGARYTILSGRAMVGDAYRVYRIKEP